MSYISRLFRTLRLKRNLYQYVLINLTGQKGPHCSNTPWCDADSLRTFKAHTEGHAIVGSVDAILAVSAKQLPNPLVIIGGLQDSTKIPGYITLVNDIEDLYHRYPKFKKLKLCVIGSTDLFKSTLKYAKSVCYVESFDPVYLGHPSEYPTQLLTELTFLPLNKLTVKIYVGKRYSHNVRIAKINRINQLFYINLLGKLEVAAHRTFIRSIIKPT